jgi:hypothetical protein
MRITWTTISAGIMASIAVVLFMMIIPQILGMGTIDLTGDVGRAFSTQAPHVAGSIFLAVIGIIWSSIFASVYNSLPGNNLMKGGIYGIMVGLFSLIIMPNIITTLATIVGSSSQYSATQFGMDTTSLVTMLAYMMFGVTLALTYRPTETSTNV